MIFKFSMTIKALTGSGLFYRVFYHKLKSQYNIKIKRLYRLRIYLFIYLKKYKMDHRIIQR
jgi:hypothetical protein